VCHASSTTGKPSTHVGLVALCPHGLKSRSHFLLQWGPPPLRGGLAMAAAAEQAAATRPARCAAENQGCSGESWQATVPGRLEPLGRVWASAE